MPRIMYRDAIANAIAEEMRRDDKVFIMGEDIALTGGVYKATRGLLDEFGPKRVRNTALSEIAIAGLAAGAAMAGARPIAEIMHVDFVGVCFDIILNQISKVYYKTNGKVSVPIVIRTQGGRGHSNGPTQSQSLEALFTQIPGLKVIMPSTPYDAKGLLKTAIRDNNPVIFIEHKGLYQTKGEVPDEEYTIPFGIADIKRHGRDVTIISWSKTVLTALEAAEKLEEIDIKAEVIDLRSLVPLDFETISESVKKTGRVIITHEACERGGYGGEVAALIANELFDELDAPIQRICGSNIPVPNCPIPERESAPTVEKLISAAKIICNHNVSGETKKPLVSDLMTTAKRVHQSLLSTAQTNLKIDTDLNRLLEFRDEINRRYKPEGNEISVIDIITAICARALSENTQANAFWGTSGIHFHNYVNVGIALHSANGQIIPVIKDADILSLKEISIKVNELRTKAYEGRLAKEEISDGTFTIYDLGLLGVDSFTAVLNYPETCALAIGRIKDSIVADNGQVQVHPKVNLCLTFDHQVIDGADAARLLKTIREYIDDPSWLLKR